MFGIRVKTICAVGISLVLFGLTLPSVRAASAAPTEQGKDVKAVVQITKQEYCSAGPEIVLVYLSLKITVTNSSSESIYFRSKMQANYGQLAHSLKDARNGKFFKDIGGSIFLDPNEKPGRRIQVKPGRSVVLQKGFLVLARHIDTPKPGIDNTVPPGKYALQIYLRSYTLAPKKKSKRNRREELALITPEPFLIQIQKKDLSSLTPCE